MYTDCGRLQQWHTSGMQNATFWATMNLRFVVVANAGSASGLAAKDSGVKPALNGGSVPPSSAAPAATAHVAFDWNSIKVGSPYILASLPIICLQLPPIHPCFSVPESSLQCPNINHILCLRLLCAKRFLTQAL